MPRSIQGSTYHEVAQIIEQATRIGSGKPIKSHDGSEIGIVADTLCVHGDNQSSIDAIQLIRAALSQAGRP